MNEHLFIRGQGIGGGRLCNHSAPSSICPQPSNRACLFSLPVYAPSLPACTCCTPVTSPYPPQHPPPPVPSSSVIPNFTELVLPAPCFMCAELVIWPSHGPFTHLALNLGSLGTHLITPRLHAPEAEAACGPFLYQRRWAALQGRVESPGFKSQLCHHWLWDLEQVT